MMGTEQIALTILTSIITGGFVLVFIEIGNRSNREDDRHDQIMYPFMHKLSAYFRFMSWCSSHIGYNMPLSGYEKEIKPLIDEMSHYGGFIITAGGDYGVGYFTAEQLYDIASTINNIWYWYDKMRPCRMNWNNSIISNELIMKELSELNPVYLRETLNVNLVANVSGDFYVDVYQPIERETFRYEEHQRHYKRQTKVLAGFFCFVLLVISLLLFNFITPVLLQIATFVVILMLVVSFVMLAVDMRMQIEWYHNIKKQFIKCKPSIPSRTRTCES